MPVELEKTAVTGYGFARKMRDGRISADTSSERSVFEKGGTRGGSAAPPGPKWAEKPRFFRETTGRMVGNAQRFKLKLLYLGG